MKALFWSAVINGIAAVPIMVAMMVVARRTAVMGPFLIRPLLAATGWLATLAMAAAAIAMICTA